MSRAAVRAGEAGISVVWKTYQQYSATSRQVSRPDAVGIHSRNHVHSFVSCPLAATLTTPAQMLARIRRAPTRPPFQSRPRQVLPPISPAPVPSAPSFAFPEKSCALPAMAGIPSADSSSPALFFETPAAHLPSSVLEPASPAHHPASAA